MAAAPTRKKTTSELYTATRDAERLYADSETELHATLGRIGDVSEPAAKEYIKKLAHV